MPETNSNAQLSVQGVKEPLTAKPEKESNVAQKAREEIRSQISKKSLLRSTGMRRASSVVNFGKTLGLGYSLPTANHKYEILHGLKFGDFGVKPKDYGYMTQIVKRAKSCVDPRKYTHQSDWKKKTKEKDMFSFTHSKRITLADQMLIDKKSVPGPSHYDNSGLKSHVSGFYRPTEGKLSVTGSIAFEKHYIPSPAAYESRGRSMSEILNERKKKYLYVYKPDPKALKVTCKVKKTNDPAPTTYEFP